MRFPARGQRGFTLIETVVAISVFSIMTVGIAPLLLSSLRGSSLARSYTVAKNLAQESMERVRGFPFYDTAPKRDLADLYFPNVATGYDAATKTFVTTCTSTSSTPAASGALACPPDHSDGTATIPAGYSIMFRAQFLRPANTVPETYTVETPPATYNSNVAEFSIPPTSLMRMVVRVNWTQGGVTKQFELTSLIGNRKISTEKLRASGSVDFLIQALATYTQQIDSDSKRQSSLRAIVGRSSSSVEVRNFATADVDSIAGRFTLTRDEFEGTPGSTLADVASAQAIFRAPPDRSPLGTTSSGAVNVTHPDLGIQVGHLTTAAVNEATPATSVSVVNELPLARSNFSLTGAENQESFWMANQSDPGVLGLGGILNVAANRILAARRDPSGARLSGSTLAQATALTPAASRKVESQATASFSRLMIMPTSFTENGGGVVEIRNFVANFTCLARGTAGAPTASGSWSATLRFWRSGSCSGLGCTGSYQEVPLAGSTTPGAGTGASALAALQAENPVVKGSTNPNQRIFLFDDPASGRPGYISSWSTTELIPSTAGAESANVSMDSALSIITGETNPEDSQTKVALTVGKISCRAVDKRG